MNMPIGAYAIQTGIWDDEEEYERDRRAKALIRKYAIEEAYGEAIEKLYFKQKRTWREAEQAAKIWTDNVKAGISEIDDAFADFYDLNEIDYYALIGDKAKVDELLDDAGVYQERWDSACEDALYHEPYEDCSSDY